MRARHQRESTVRGRSDRCPRARSCHRGPGKPARQGASASTLRRPTWSPRAACGTAWGSPAPRRTTRSSRGPAAAPPGRGRPRSSGTAARVRRVEAPQRSGEQRHRDRCRAEQAGPRGKGRHERADHERARRHRRREPAGKPQVGDEQAVKEQPDRRREGEGEQQAEVAGQRRPARPIAPQARARRGRPACRRQTPPGRSGWGSPQRRRRVARDRPQTGRSRRGGSPADRARRSPRAPCRGGWEATARRARRSARRASTGSRIRSRQGHSDHTACTPSTKIAV